LQQFGVKGHFNEDLNSLQHALLVEMVWVLQEYGGSIQLNFATTLHHSQHFDLKFWYKNAGC
jgi:hypothetical protein